MTLTNEDAKRGKFIVSYFHCKRCIPKGDGKYSPWLEVGWTEKGIQVWCHLCDQEVVHLDFKGQKIAYAEKHKKQDGK